jgi:glycosyltransferase involved in cell wall biosynthesis
LKVLMVQTFHFRRGGDSTYMLSLSALLREKGHEVVHFAMSHPDNFPSPHSEYFPGEIDFPALLESSSPASAWKVLTRSISSREARDKIARLADDTKPDIAHFHNIHGHLTTSIIGPLVKRGIPIVWTCHDYRLVCPNTSLLSHGEVCERCLPVRYWNAPLQRCKKGSFAASFVAMLSASWERMTGVPRRIDRFIAPSRFLAGKLVEGRIDGSRITVIPNFTALDARSDVPEGDYFIYTGRLLPEKGIDLLIRAAGAVEGARLLIVGEGPMEGQLKKEAEKYGGGRVEFTGFLSGEDFARTVAGTRFVVLPSRWYENLPFSIMEAMAAGKPVVASDIGGIPEMVDDGVTGMLFPSGDVKALRDCLERMNGDAELRREMGMKGREKAERLYGREKHYVDIMEIYGAVRKARS